MPTRVRPPVKSAPTPRPQDQHMPIRGQESLRAPEEFLRTIGDTLPKALVYQATHSPDGSYRFTYISRGIEELAGVTVAYALEHPEALTAPIVEEDRPGFWAAIERSLRTLSPLDHVCRTRVPGGPLRWCHFRSSVRPEPDGSIVCEGIEMDVTAVKVAEEALLDSQARHQLDRLEIARASRVTMLGEIAASLAHELNQPLAAIVTNAQAGRRFVDRSEMTPAGMKELLRDIAEQGKRAGEVIQRLRAWIDRDEPPRQPLCISQVIQEVQHLIHGELITRHVRVRTHLARSLPKILGDRVQLQQVIVNLVLNAAEAMHDRSPDERLVAIRTSQSNGEVLVEIADRGTGIQYNHLDRIFDAFFTTKPEGLGMGLRICASIVSGHGGRIWAANNDPIGATFFFTLPVASEPHSSA